MSKRKKVDLMEAIRAVVDSSDDTGCEGDLTVTSRKAVKSLRKIVKLHDWMYKDVTDPADLPVTTLDKLREVQDDGVVEFPMTVPVNELGDVERLNDLADKAFLGGDLARYTLSDLAFRAVGADPDGDSDGWVSGSVTLLVMASVEDILEEAEEDREEQDRRDEKNGLHGGLEDPAN